MANEVVAKPVGGNLPDHLREFVDPARKNYALAEAGVPFRRLSTDKDVWSLVDTSGVSMPLEVEFQGSMIAAPYIDVVICEASWFTSRTYYGANYDPDTPTPPVCGSTDGIQPDARFGESRQAKPTPAGQYLCQVNCAWDAWQTGQGGRGKACKQHKILALLLPWELTNGEQGEPVQLRVPADSMKLWNMFVGQCEREGGSFDLALVRLRLKDKNIVFERIDWLSRESILLVKKWQKDPFVDRVIYVGADVGTNEDGSRFVRHPAPNPVSTPPVNPIPAVAQQAPPPPMPTTERQAAAAQTDAMAAARAAGVKTNGAGAPVAQAPVTTTATQTPAAKATPTTRRRVSAAAAPPAPVEPPPPPPPTDEERLAAYDALVEKAQKAFDRIATAEDAEETAMFERKYQALKAEVEAVEDVLTKDGLLTDEEDGLETDVATAEAATGAVPAAGGNEIGLASLIGSLDKTMGQVPAV